MIRINIVQTRSSHWRHQNLHLAIPNLTALLNLPYPFYSMAFSSRRRWSLTVWPIKQHQYIHVPCYTHTWMQEYLALVVNTLAHTGSSPRSGSKSRVDLNSNIFMWNSQLGMLGSWYYITYNNPLIKNNKVTSLKKKCKIMVPPCTYVCTTQYWNAPEINTAVYLMNG